MYLDEWYAVARQGRTGSETIPLSVLYDQVRSFKKGYALTKAKLGRDLAKASFPCVRDHTRHGSVYTISW